MLKLDLSRHNVGETLTDVSCAKDILVENLTQILICNFEISAHLNIIWAEHFTKSQINLTFDLL